MTALLLALWCSLARAATPVEEAQRYELERARAEIAGEVQLYAYDLVDELVYGWTEQPPFAAPTPVILVDVSVPVGLGTGLKALLETHLAQAIVRHPDTQVQLVHCPSCTAVVVHSGPEGTVVQRGADDPAVLERLGATNASHALYVDVEAEGAFLVLRARLTELGPERIITWSRTLSTSANTAALLREPGRLTSATEAREEYLRTLQGRGTISIPARFAVRSFAKPDDGEGVRAPPLLFLQSGFEMAATDARTWTSSILFGYAWVPEGYQGLMVQGRVSRLVSGTSRSLTRPDLYLFVGGAVTTVWGPAAVVFRDDVITSDDLLTDFVGLQPRSTFGTLQAGLDLRVGDRIGISQALETNPALNDSPNMGSYVTLFGLPFPGLTTEVAFWF